MVVASLLFQGLLLAQTSAPQPVPDSINESPGTRPVAAQPPVGGSQVDTANDSVKSSDRSSNSVRFETATPSPTSVLSGHNNPFRPGSPPPASSGPVAPRQFSPSAQLVPVQPPQQNGLAATLISESLEPPATGAIQGQPVGLVTLLGDVTESPQQLVIIQSVWKLSSQIAAYHFAFDEYRRLEKLAKGISGIAPAELHSALAEAEARVQESKLSVIELQHRLSDFRPNVTSAASPIPADHPWTGQYRTHFNAIFAGRPASADRRKAKQIDELDSEFHRATDGFRPMLQEIREELRKNRPKSGAA